MWPKIEDILTLGIGLGVLWKKDVYTLFYKNEIYKNIEAENR